MLLIAYRTYSDLCNGDAHRDILATVSFSPVVVIYMRLIAFALSLLGFFKEFQDHGTFFLRVETNILFLNFCCWMQHHHLTHHLAKHQNEKPKN